MKSPVCFRSLLHWLLISGSSLLFSTTISHSHRPRYGCARHPVACVPLRRYRMFSFQPILSPSGRSSAFSQSLLSLAEGSIHTEARSLVNREEELNEILHSDSIQLFGQTHKQMQRKRRTRSMPLSQKWYKAKQQHISKAQKRAISELWPIYGVDLKYDQPLDLHTLWSNSVQGGNSNKDQFSGGSTKFVANSEEGLDMDWNSEWETKDRSMSHSPPFPSAERVSSVFDGSTIDSNIINTIINNNMSNNHHDHNNKNNINAINIKNHNNESSTHPRPYPYIVLDIGFGTGDSICEQAINRPDRLFLGCEIHRAGIAAALRTLNNYFNASDNNNGSNNNGVGNDKSCHTSSKDEICSRDNNSSSNNINNNKNNKNNNNNSNNHNNNNNNNNIEESADDRGKDNAKKVSNVKLIRADVQMLLSGGYLPHNSLSEVCVFFPDPWPNTERDAERRVIRAELLTLLERLMCPGGVLRVATDVEAYALHVQQVMQQGRWGFMNRGYLEETTKMERPYIAADHNTDAGDNSRGKPLEMSNVRQTVSWQLMQSSVHAPCERGSPLSRSLPHSLPLSLPLSPLISSPTSDKLMDKDWKLENSSHNDAAIPGQQIDMDTYQLSENLGFLSQIPTRPVTKYEYRAKDLGHSIWEFEYQLTKSA